MGGATLALGAVLALAIVAGGSAAPTKKSDTTKAAVITDIGGLGDKGFNDLCAKGVNTAKKKLGIAAVYVTHDQETASAMSDRIAIMRSGQIEQIDTPSQIYERPRNRFVAEFLGDVNLLEPSSIGPLKFGKRTISLGGNTLTIQDDDSSEIERP